MKKNVQKALVGVIVLLGYTTGNYGAGFIDSPSNFAATQSSVSTANYGGGFISAPNLDSGSTYTFYNNRTLRNYGGGFIQSPPAWRHLTFWY